MGPTVLGAPAGQPVDELPDEQVDHDRVPGRREMAGALEDDQRRPGQLGQPVRSPQRLAAVVVAVDDQQRRPDPPADGLRLLLFSWEGASIEASIASRLASRPQPTQSSTCLV
jgi:hypothetical protein